MSFCTIACSSALKQSCGRVYDEAYAILTATPRVCRHKTSKSFSTEGVPRFAITE